jgi:purine-binding chemotaxis protein CheW
MQTDPAKVETPSRPASQWAFFRCGDRGFAIPIDRVAEIVPPAPTTRLPGTGPMVVGLVGFRGRVITLFDLGVIAGTRPAAEWPGHRLVFVRKAGRLFGFAVETMVTITAAEGTGGISEAPAGLELGDVTGTVGLDGQPYAQLDVDHLLGRLLA